MSGFIIGRLYAWPEFAEDGEDIWLVHLDDPTFFMRVIHRPETGLPSGDVRDLAFPLTSDSRYALGNLMFVEPSPVDTHELATLLAGAIEAIHDETVATLLGLAGRPFAPVPDLLVQEDLPSGFVVGIFCDTSGDIDVARWIAHVGLPPFAMRVSDLTEEEDLANDDIWATVEGETVLSHLVWLSSVGCAEDEIRYLATTGAEILREVAALDMPPP